jgi:hypothetical protein
LQIFGAVSNPSGLGILGCMNELVRMLDVTHLIQFHIKANHSVLNLRPQAPNPINPESGYPQFILNQTCTGDNKITQLEISLRITVGVYVPDAVVGEWQIRVILFKRKRTTLG